jgi:glutamyl-Q tRNA(Asp) synthetase
MKHDQSPAPYRGRFAPSPTGHLHFGSLIAAVASYLAARQAGGEWLIRMEDLDQPRVVPGSAESILKTLADFGFEWTGSIARQSERTDLYETALKRLREAGYVYPCSCSRKEIAAAGQDGEEARYPGWCRNGPLHPDASIAIRFRTDAGETCFNDEIQGPVRSDVNAESGDFVMKRRDGLFAYQLAVVVDDAEQGVTHIVRGADLLNSTPRQLLVQQSLGVSTPKYAHVPLAIDHRGVKLSKSAGAGAVDATKPAEELWRALRFLRQQPPGELRSSPLKPLWEWAVHHWTTSPLHGIREAAVDAELVNKTG